VLSSTVSIVDLGVVIDSRLTMSDQVTALCRAGYYQLRHCVRCRGSITARGICRNTSPLQAFISNRLDYCNALYSIIVIVCTGVCSRSRMRRRAV